MNTIAVLIVATLAAAGWLCAYWKECQLELAQQDNADLQAKLDAAARRLNELEAARHARQTQPIEWRVAE